MRKIILAAALSLGFSAPAYAGVAYLTAEWFENGDQMCKYENGTVLNVGARTCPLNIQT